MATWLLTVIGLNSIFLFPIFLIFRVIWIFELIWRIGFLVIAYLGAELVVEKYCY